MRLSEIEKKARGAGVKDTWKFSKKDLIKSIQKVEGNYPCFGTPKSGVCVQMACCWRSDCLR
ncbi:MAG: SAP domain-containing protein [Candidatus Omnitrophica bacterium]|nr:SAP domain-containing protein [Candidatus Omnitrophota bacterium]MBU1869401.1 SAP domain-containing protein [Candidatus Omnitrophota bacterium]